jgi:uncharacterized delta-60 repeat protein
MKKAQTNMARSLKLFTTALVVLGLLAGSAMAKPPAKSGARLDPSYGKSGLAITAVPKSEAGIGMVVSRSGDAYLLDGSLVLAFEADGKPDRGFGKNGRVKVTSTGGGSDPVGLAVDSQGRVLVTGNIYVGQNRVISGSPEAGPAGYWQATEVYVIRLLPNGNRDLTFGSGGEVDTDFGVPRPTGAPGSGVEAEKTNVRATTIAVDSQDRPIIGGEFTNSVALCGYAGGTTAPFVARMTTAGAIDTSFAGKGYSVLPEEGGVTGLARTSAGFDTIGHGVTCGARNDETPSTFNAIGEGGELAPGLDPTRPSFYMRGSLTVDPKERALVVETPPLGQERPLVLVRLLSSGAVDQSFGHGGGTPFAGGVFTPSAISVDAESRPILASSGESENTIRLMRLLANGKIDRSFGKHGSIEVAPASHAELPAAVRLDGRGRIYVVRSVEDASLKTGYGVEVARFLPGR